MTAEKKVTKIIDADLKDIMPTFLENRQKDLNNIQQALQNKDFKSIQVIGHKLAGNAGSYGLADLGEIGAKIEMSAIKQDYDELNHLYQQFVEYMGSLEIIYK
ncbi:MAG: hypothetical protein Fur0010_07970 [Bdellovibrio sp.]